MVRTRLIHTVFCIESRCKGDPMNPTIKPIVSLLVVLGILDVAVAPFMLATTGKHAPPPPAAALSVVFGLAIVAGAQGLTQGAGWARRLIFGGLGVRLFTGVLSIGATIPVALRVEGVANCIGSAVCVVVVARMRTRRPALVA